MYHFRDIWHSRRNLLVAVGVTGTLTLGMLYLGGRAIKRIWDNRFDINTDETKVPAYQLPDPLRMADGSRIDTAEAWRTKRRQELLGLFEREVYGRTPTRNLNTRIEIVESSDKALGGRSRRVQMRLTFGASSDQSAELLLYLPKGRVRPVPAILGLNFWGNHTVHKDPAIHVSNSWFPDEPLGTNPGNRAGPATRGRDANAWAIERANERGYAVATMYCGDFDPDFDDGFRNGIHRLLDPPGTSDPNRPANAWGAIGAWAWGLSRGREALGSLSDIDSGRIVVVGHSRLGKTALWAGAQDQRFALVVSNNSGCGGAKLSKRHFGESVKSINAAFPHWFCDRFSDYGDSTATLPVDQHELIALIAPRPVLVCSAAQDLWTDPKGEFLACVGAAPVFRLLGTDGLATQSMPPVNEFVSSTIGYHLRPGGHDAPPSIWDVYLDFADKHLP